MILASFAVVGALFAFLSLQLPLAIPANPVPFREGRVDGSFWVRLANCSCSSIGSADAVHRRRCSFT